MDTTAKLLVMLIDDNELDNFVNKKLIENENLAEDIIVCQSAMAGLEYLRSKSPAPHLIFLDIMMPGMDGFGFLEQYDKLEDGIKSKTKIIMLSTTESFKDLNRANQNKYVHKFLNKPLTIEALKALKK